MSEPHSAESSTAATAPSQEAVARLREERRRVSTDAHWQAADRILLFILLDLILLCGYLLTGVVATVEVAAFGVGGGVTVAVFRFAIARGWHLQGSGIALAVGVTCLFSAHLLAFAFYVPQVGLLMLMTLITVIAMTALTLPVQYTSIICIVLGVCAAVLMGVHGSRLSLPMGSWPEQVLSALWFTMLLGRGALLNLKGRELTQALTRESAALAQALDQLKWFATHDDLTGVLNRHAVMKVLAEELARSDRTGRPFSVALFDIDKFKQINDQLGHGAGDKVLIQFAALFRAAVRNTDRFSRFGGEEFLLVMPEEQTPDSAVQTANRLRSLIEQHTWSSIDQSLTVTVSAGVATLNTMETVEQVIARADKALYRAKTLGRNRVDIG